MRPRFAVLTERRSRRAALGAGGVGLAAVLAGLDRAGAQQATPAASGERAEFLFVQSFGAGTLAPAGGAVGIYRLTLREGVDRTLYFSERPQRLVGVIPTEQFLEVLAQDGADPLNAALVAQRSGDGAPAGEAVWVVELLRGAHDPATGGLGYEVRLLAAEEVGRRFDFVPAAAPAGPVELGAGYLFIDKTSRKPDLGGKIIEEQ